MELTKRIEQLQARANELAIQESNLRAKIEPLAILQAQLSLVLAEKNQVIGAINSLHGLVADQAQSSANDSSGVKRRNVR